MGAKQQRVSASMPHGIEEKDFWWFRELYDVVVAFADDPKNTISRLHEINVPEDHANDLHNFRKNILQKYGARTDLEILQVTAEIGEILDRKSLGGKDFEEKFWTNRAFQLHHDWVKIRELARSFLLR